jgi:signal transduction histidine kinase
MSYRRVPLATVVAATLVAVTTLLLVPFSLATYRADERSEWDSLRGLAAVHASALAAALAMPVWNIDRAQVDKVIEAMARPKSIYGIRVDAAGAAHGRVRDKDWRLVPWKDHALPSDLLIEERPITFSGDRIGTVQLMVSPRFVESSLRASLIRRVTMIVSVDLLLILCTYFLLWRIVLAPLVKMERYAVAVRDGAVASKIAGGEFPREIESLRSSIEAMVALLGTRYAELEKLRRTEKMASMGLLVAGVAHEVRNPLFGMSAMVDAYSEELSQHGLGDLSASLRTEIGRLKHLMSELLEFGKPVEINPTPESLHDLIGEVVDARTRTVDAATVRLSNQVDEQLPPIAMDRPRLRQVFENLIDNAIQHSPPGESVTISAKELTESGKKWIECRVEDRGAGFLSFDLPRAFEPFYTRRENGTGLGLSIVQRIVEEHDGHVTAGNREGGGAVITVLLPALG